MKTKRGFTETLATGIFLLLFGGTAWGVGDLLKDGLVTATGILLFVGGILVFLGGITRYLDKL